MASLRAFWVLRDVGRLFLFQDFFSHELLFKVPRVFSHSSQALLDSREMSVLIQVFAVESSRTAGVTQNGPRTVSAKTLSHLLDAAKIGTGTGIHKNAQRSKPEASEKKNSNSAFDAPYT